MVPLTDIVRMWVSAVHNILPASLIDVLDAIYLNALSIIEKYFNLLEASLADTLPSLTLQSLLPPLISLLTIYFTVVSLYHTTSFFVRSTVFLVKWGALIGVVIVAVGIIASAVMPDSLGILHRSAARRGPSRSGKPRVWDTFEEHQRWRQGEPEEHSQAADAGRVAREMVEKFVDTTMQVATQGGWWGTLSGLAADTFGSGDRAVPTTKRRRPKGARGKGKSR